MADSLRISQRAYSSIENGKTQLTVDRLLDIATILDVPSTELIDGAKTPLEINNFNHSQRDNNTNNIVFAQINIDEIKELYERIIAIKDKEIEELKQRLAVYDKRLNP